MSNSLDARAAILGRIREALQDVTSGDLPTVARTYRQRGTTEREELVQRFIERVADYKVNLRRVAEQDLSTAISAACTVHGVRHLVTPVDLPANWLPENLEQLCDGPPLTNEQLGASDGVLTGCALGIAQTGTIVLDGGAWQGRRVLTLLPDYHLCVIFERQIVDLVPEAIASLSEAVCQHQLPITLISGPSATSDIELNRVEGVHGPRTLEVLIVHEGQR